MIAKALSDEDRVLWSLVARSAKPLKGSRIATAAPVPPESASPEEPLAQPPVSGSVAPQPRREQVAQKFDGQIRDKLVKGRLPIEGRVDLHGMTQAEAYDLLLAFLRRAYEGGVRYVLVITGKGSSSGGDGILRRSVPSWLKTAPFRPLVSGLDEAGRRHGGGGALYVRLRRRERD